MRISDMEMKKLVQQGGHAVAAVQPDVEPSPRETDGSLIEQVTHDVMAMPDREAMVAELKAKIDAGTYRPTGEEIADSMIRRAVADRLVRREYPQS